MKEFKLMLFLLCIFFLYSCIAEEPLNSECDIEVCSVHLDAADTVFYSVSDTVQKVNSRENTIIYSIREQVLPEDLSQVRVFLKLTEGATVYPENGSVQDFSKGNVHYTVVSEDKSWQRNYEIGFIPMTVLNPVFDFEHSLKEPKGRYSEWYAYNKDNTPQYLWATGNSGFALSRSSALPEEYPTIPLETGKEGKGVLLQTCSTGSFGSMVNMPIAAGSLFLGTFDTQNALKDAMKATRFGVPVNQKPLRFTGYYKFMPGAEYKDRTGTVISGKTDAPDAYAVLYQNTDEAGNPVTLYGDDVLTHEQIVAVARVGNFEQTGVQLSDPWAHFDLSFEYRKEIDWVRLRNFGYNLTVVFTSSIDGAVFCGAEGSTLLIDESQIIFE